MNAACIWGFHSWEGLAMHISRSLSRCLSHCYWWEGVWGQVGSIWLYFLIDTLCSCCNCFFISILLLRQIFKVLHELIIKFLAELGGNWRVSRASSRRNSQPVFGTNYMTENVHWVSAVHNTHDSHHLELSFHLPLGSKVVASREYFNEKQHLTQWSRLGSTINMKNFLLGHKSEMPLHEGWPTL